MHTLLVVRNNQHLCTEVFRSSLNVWTGKNRPAGWGRTDTNVVQKSKFWYGSTECPWVRNDWIAGERGYDWETLHVLPQVSHSFAAQRIKAHTKPRGAQKKLGLGPFERETVVYYFEKERIHWSWIDAFSIEITQALG